jgi:hypothetical protein
MFDVGNGRTVVWTLERENVPTLAENLSARI